MFQTEITRPDRLFNKPSPMGLNDFLFNPSRIPLLSTEGSRIPQIITDEQWKLLYGINTRATQLISESYNRQSAGRDLFQLPIGMDNGMLIAAQNKKNPDQFTSIYLSAYGYEASDWKEGLMIPYERIKCFQIQLISRQLIGEGMYAASEYRYRTTRDFQAIEGDKRKRDQLNKSEISSGSEMTFFDIFMRMQSLFIEQMDQETGRKNMLPLFQSHEEFWKATLAADGIDLWNRILEQKLTETEVNRYVHEFAGKMVFDIEAIGEITKGIIDHTTATRRAAPIVTEYFNDILHNLNNSHVVPIQPIHFHPYEMDPRQMMMSRYQSCNKGIIRK